MAKTPLSQRGISDYRLTDKQRTFCHEYLIDFNASRAAKIAGYANPASISSRLLKDNKVQTYLGKHLHDRYNENEATAERIIKELVLASFFDVKDLLDENGKLVCDDLGSIPEGIRRCIQGIQQRDYYDKEGNYTGTQTTFKLIDKLNSLSLLAKMIGALDEKNVELNLYQLDWDEMMQPPLPKKKGKK